MRPTKGFDSHIVAAAAAFFGLGVTVVLANNRASHVCGDVTGYNCLYQSNENEYVDVLVEFDKNLPSWLVGTLIRNGVGLFERGQQSVTHIFDGFAKLSSWKFLPNGTTLFSTAFIRSNFYKETMSDDHLAPNLFFNEPDPPFNIFEKGQSLIRGIDNMNVNIMDFPESQGKPAFAAFSDFWRVYEFSGDDLSTIDLIKPKLNGGESFVHINIASSAHPLPEPGTNNRLTYLVRQRILPFFNNRLSLVRMSSVSGRSLIAEWKIKEDVPYMHSFSVTQTKAIMVTGPLVADNNCIFKKAAALPCMEWIEGKTSTLYIVDFKTGDKNMIELGSTLFAIHHINAYDLSDDKIVMDVVSYDSPEIVTKTLLTDTIRNEENRKDAFVTPRIRRVRIDLSLYKADVQDMSTTTTDGLDMPVINEEHRSQHYCYVYGVTNFADGERFESTAIVKKDMCNDGSLVGTLLIDSHYPVEPAFVPNPNGETEDDGVLLVPILRGVDAVTYMAVVDAKAMTIISKADMPDFLPFSLHGRFIQNFY